MTYKQTNKQRVYACIQSVLARHRQQRFVEANKAQTRLALNAIAITDKHGRFDMPAMMTFQYCIDV